MPTSAPLWAGPKRRLPLLPGHFLSIIGMVLFTLCQARCSSEGLSCQMWLLLRLQSSLQRPLPAARGPPRGTASAARGELPLDGITAKSEQWDEKMPKSLFLCISYILNSFEIQEVVSYRAKGTG